MRQKRGFCPKTKPIQTQSKPIQTQSNPIQSQNKPNSNPTRSELVEGSKVEVSNLFQTTLAITTKIIMSNKISLTILLAIFISISSQKIFNIYRATHPQMLRHKTRPGKANQQKCISSCLSGTFNNTSKQSNYTPDGFEVNKTTNTHYTFKYSPIIAQNYPPLEEPGSLISKNSYFSPRYLTPLAPMSQGISNNEQGILN